MEITVNDLTKRFGSKTAADIPHLRISDGEIVGLVGNNGAGKTTLFRLMLDLLKPDTGCVTIGGIDVSRSEDWKETTGAYLDESFLIDYLTPEEYFTFICKMSGCPAFSEEMLTPFARFMNGEILGQRKFIRNLSAGNKQKVGIIAAMLSRPRTLLLDEPFNFLDPTSQSVLGNIILRYREETGATVLISSHNLMHTVDISTRIMLMEHGLIIRDFPGGGSEARAELEAYFGV